jgi:excisionase family DNA binding protein
MLSLEFVAFRSKANAPVMQGAVTLGSHQLLTVKEVAAQLRTSTATVYGLCARGELEHVRASTHSIRVSVDQLSRFIQRRSR